MIIISINNCIVYENVRYSISNLLHHNWKKYSEKLLFTQGHADIAVHAINTHLRVQYVEH